MTAVVRLALARPYTFVVMAILVMIFGVMSAIRTPTDIFPNIGIPVISVVWGYTGLAPDDMSETASRRGHAADHPCLQRLERPDYPVGVIQRHSLPGGAVRYRTEFYSAAAPEGRRRPASVRLWRSDPPSADRPRPECAARPQSFSHGHRRGARHAKPDQSGRHGENRLLRVHRRSQRFPQSGR